MPASELDVQLTWLFARQRFGVKPGLERVRALLKRLSDPQEAFAVVLVGGTNGKGSCSSTLATILSCSGRRTGLFTSPHLTRFGERFLVDGAEVSENDLLAGLAAARPHAEALGATFFEIVTALACLLFARAGVEVAIMEVGLGGRFDATNVLSPRLSIITGVALDHTDVLGDTVAEIALDKAGIMRPDTLTLTGATDDPVAGTGDDTAEGGALTVLRDAARTLGAPLWALGHEITVDVRDRGWSGLSLGIGSPLGRAQVTTPLLGLHQAPNVALAVVAAQVLGASGAALAAGAAQTRWPGRLEPLHACDRTFLLDGAHNPQAAQALARALLALGVTPAKLVFGISADKNVAEIVGVLEPFVSEVVVTRARLSPRSASPEKLAAYWSVPTFVADTPRAALDTAHARTRSGEVVVVAGSLYLVGEVRPLLLGETAEAFQRLQ